MNLHMVDDNTYSIEIGIDAEEEELGVRGGRFISWKRIAIYIYELSDGNTVAGISAAAPWHMRADVDILRARARRNAINQIAKLRETQARRAGGGR